MKTIEKYLGKLADFQYKHYKLLLVIVTIITLFMIIGIPKLGMESDLSKMSPQELEINQLNDRVSEKFGGQDIILILLQISDNSDSKDLPNDIRDYSIIKYVTDLTESLEKENSIEGVTSIGNVFSQIPNYDQNVINNVLSQTPEVSMLFSKNYKTTFLMVRGDVGSSEKKVVEFTELIQNKIDTFSKPPGTKIMITGSPPMQTTVLNILFKDAQFTLLIAGILIFILLIFLEKSLLKAILISVPLFLGLIWTLGTMGWIGLEISIATAGLGAMILGLGVEYGVFMLTRYLEERHKNGQKESLKIAVPGVGSAILGSGITTTLGFLALTASMMPMMQKLGLSLALGIFYCLFSAILISPVVFIGLENTIYRFDGYMKKFFYKRCEEHEKR